MCFMMEVQVNYIARCINQALRYDVKALEVTQCASDAYQAYVI